jgi:hypothetical protein
VIPFCHLSHASLWPKGSWCTAIRQRMHHELDRSIRSLCIFDIERRSKQLSGCEKLAGPLLPRLTPPIIGPCLAHPIRFENLAYLLQYAQGQMGGWIKRPLAPLILSVLQKLSLSHPSGPLLHTNLTPKKLLSR